MVDIVLGGLIVLLRIVGVIFRIVQFVWDLQRLARLITGSDRIIAVPPDPKPLPAAARRALAEADARRCAGERGGTLRA